jgi:hypothetical protein
MELLVAQAPSFAALPVVPADHVHPNSQHAGSTQGVFSWSLGDMETWRHGGMEPWSPSRPDAVMATGVGEEDVGGKDVGGKGEGGKGVGGKGVAVDSVLRTKEVDTSPGEGPLRHVASAFANARSSQSHLLQSFGSTFLHALLASISRLRDPASHRQFSLSSCRKLHPGPPSTIQRPILTVVLETNG